MPIAWRHLRGLVFDDTDDCVCRHDGALVSSNGLRWQTMSTGCVEGAARAPLRDKKRCFSPRVGRRVSLDACAV